MLYTTIFIYNDIIIIDTRLIFNSVFEKKMTSVYQSTVTLKQFNFQLIKKTCPLIEEDYK